MGIRVRAISAGLALGGAFPAVTATPAEAHDYGSCGTSTQPRWNTTSWLYRLSPTFVGNGYEQGIDQAAANFNAPSDFDWFKTTSGVANAINWYNLNSANTSLAGQASMGWTSSPCVLTSATLYLNKPHFEALNHQNSFNTVGHKTCSAVHEFGHGAGLAHNTLSIPESIMQEGSHTDRCANAYPITHLHSHDTSDLNAMY